LELGRWWRKATLWWKAKPRQRRFQKTFFAADFADKRR
jgi:hypothetical protein